MFQLSRTRLSFLFPSDTKLVSGIRDNTPPQKQPCILLKCKCGWSFCSPEKEVCWEFLNGFEAIKFEEISRTVAGMLLSVEYSDPYIGLLVC